MLKKVNQLLTQQLKLKIAQLKFNVDTTYDQREAWALAKLQEILSKQEINGEYPQCDISQEQINSLINSFL